MNLYNIELPTYEPTEVDLAFTASLMGSLRIGGIWGIPRCALSYQKTSASTIKLIGYLESDDKNLKMAQAMDHHALKACCEKLGLEVDESILENSSPLTDDDTLE